MKRILLLASVALVSLAGCNIHDDTDDCPGGVSIGIYVEKFQSEEGKTIPENSEALFKTRISELIYYLYRGGELAESGTIDFSGAGGQTYTFTRNSLREGDYTLVLYANTADNRPASRALPGWTLSYPGYERTKDYFSDRFGFKVEYNKQSEYVTQLKRVQDIVRFNFLNLPSYITRIEVELDKLSSRSHIDGTYTNEYKFEMALSGDDLQTNADGDLIVPVMTFPTLRDEASSWTVRLYRDGQSEPFYNDVVLADLHALRNQLLDLVMDTGAGGEFSFYVNLDAKWDGSHVVGGPVVNL